MYETQLFMKYYILRKTGIYEYMNDFVAALLHFINETLLLLSHIIYAMIILNTSA